MAARTDTTLDALLEFAKEARGFDFTGYKRSSIERRVAKRMQEIGVDRYDDYLDHLELRPEEFASLFNAILINVTSFFRDPPTWEYLATEILPPLIAARGDDSPIRAWSAGCASGEEAYTLAMVLAGALGDAPFQERVKIYATDVDEEALDHARLGAYLPKQIEDVPREALDRYFEQTDQRYVFRKDLRRCVIFGRNDLVQDAPISRIDLLVCRNTLMYFTAETQAHILGRFHFALDNEGVLLLGKSEMLITHSDLFSPIELKRRAFRKVVRARRRNRERVMMLNPRDGAPGHSEDLRDAVFGTAGAAQVVLDSSRALVMGNDAARRAFGIGSSDFGRAIQDLELSYRPIELRAHLETVANEQRSLDIEGVRWQTGGRERILDIRLMPLFTDGTLMGTAITYTDVTDVSRLQDDLATSQQNLEQASEELQSTVEELETTNEELQSTNEELETTNEELQSTNEELETMNEELHSANEELETMNEELRHRTLELNDMNVFLETILTTIGLAVAVLDRQQNIQMWNRQAFELWGLTAEETEGHNLFALEIGLPVEQLKRPIRACLAGSSEREELTVDATSRRGRGFSCRVTCLPMGRFSDGNVSGVIMMMEVLGA